MKKLLVITVVIISTCFAKAQWTQCPLNGGFIYALAVEDSNVYAGTLGGGGIFYSDNYGLNWDSVNNGLPSYRNIYSIAVRGNEVFAGLAGNEIYKSTDFGASWIPLNTGQISPNTILFKGTDIFISMAAGHKGVYKSSDNGNTWHSVNNGITDTMINCMVYDNTGIYVGSMESGGIFKTINNGASWFPVNSGLPTDYIEIFSILALDTVIYTGLTSTHNGHLIYKSINGGINWTLCSTFNSYIFELAFCDSKIYAGTENGVFYSTDGYNWMPIDSGLSNNQINALVVNGLDIFAGTQGGIFLLPHDSTHWLPINNGINGFSFISIDGIGNTLFATERASGIYMTTDYGNNWLSKNNGLNNLSLQVFALNGNNAFVGNPDGLFTSQDFGDNWSFIFTGMPPNNAPSSLISFGNNIFFGEYNGLYTSCDFGVNWTSTHSGLPTPPRIFSLASNYNNEVFAAISDVGVYMSSNNGANWSNISNGFAGMPYIQHVAANDNFIFASLGTFNPPIVTSNDHGATWKVGTNGLFGHTVSALRSIGNSVFAGVNDGVFYTNDFGNNWIDKSDNLPDFPVNSVGRDDSCIYVGVEGHGIWKRPISDFAIDFTEINKPINTSSLTIFPNPATDLLYINCTENADVEIINLQGQVVATKILSGKNESVVVSSLAKGVYVVKVKTEQGVVTKKIVKQ